MYFYCNQQRRKLQFSLAWASWSTLPYICTDNKTRNWNLPTRHHQFNHRETYSYLCSLVTNLRKEILCSINRWFQAVCTSHSTGRFCTRWRAFNPFMHDARLHGPRSRNSLLHPVHACPHGRRVGAEFGWMDKNFADQIFEWPFLGKNFHFYPENFLWPLFSHQQYLSVCACLYCLRSDIHGVRMKNSTQQKV